MGEPQITLTFPAQPEYLRLVRLASADAGSRVGFDYEEIDDLKIAASEICSLVLGSAGPVTLAFTLDDDSVTLEGSAGGALHADNELSLTIIGAVVDEHEIIDGDGRTRFRLMKRRHPSSSG
jgi:serine/threonine-protein kinase RsbW